MQGAAVEAWRRAAAAQAGAAFQAFSAGGLVADALDRHLGHPGATASPKLKEFRAVATRYDKTDTSYAAAIHLAATIIASR